LMSNFLGQSAYKGVKEKMKEEGGFMNQYWGKAAVGEGEKNDLHKHTPMSRPGNSVSSYENHIYFYNSGIDVSSVLDLNQELRKMDSKHIRDEIVRCQSGKTPIVLHINSPGGSMMSGLNVMDAILACKSDVITVVEGAAASAATFLSVVGKKRYITPHSIMLIHQLRSMFMGKYDELQVQKRNADMLMGIIEEIYGKYTKIPSKKLKTILKRDLFLTAQQCLKYGLVDEILGTQGIRL